MDRALALKIFMRLATAVALLYSTSVLALWAFGIVVGVL